MVRPRASNGDRTLPCHARGPPRSGRNREPWSRPIACPVPICPGWPVDGRRCRSGPVRPRDLPAGGRRRARPGFGRRRHDAALRTERTTSGNRPSPSCGCGACRLWARCHEADRREARCCKVCRRGGCCPEACHRGTGRHQTCCHEADRRVACCPGAGCREARRHGTCCHEADRREARWPKACRHGTCCHRTRSHEADRLEACCPGAGCHGTCCPRAACHAHRRHGTCADGTHPRTMPLGQLAGSGVARRVAGLRGRGRRRRRYWCQPREHSWVSPRQGLMMTDPENDDDGHPARG